MGTELNNNGDDCCSHSQPDRSAAAINASVLATRQTVFRVAGMDCSDEVALIEKAIHSVDGVREVSANVVTMKVTIAHDERVTQRALIDAIGSAGLKAQPADVRSVGDEANLAQRARWISVGLSASLTVIGLIVRWIAFGPQWLNIALFIGAIIAGGWFIFPKALSAARRFAPDMNLLMTIAVLGAAFIGEWEEAAAVVFLFALSEMLEAFSIRRARRAIESLLDLTPATALVIHGETLEEVAVEEIAIGDHIRIKSGSRVPLDGEVVGGTSAINQAPITGESMPVEKQEGDSVFAGTINGEGSLEVRVTRPASDTMLAKIIHLVEEAQSQKAPSQRFVDIFAKYYTPAVMLLALLVFLIPPLVGGGEWFTWTYRALVLLVIACPCALVISTPVSIVSGLTAMARRGVLIKGGAFLESIGRLRALALDKTGTITEGQPRVIEVIALNGKSDNEILRIAAAIDSHSNHPLAQAVTTFATERKVEVPRSENYHSLTGRGAEAEIDGHKYFVGNHRFTHELTVCSDEIETQLSKIQNRAQSVVIVGHHPHADCKGEVLGILAIGDAIRTNAAQAIRDLHAAGIERVVMLSGDNQRTVDAIAKEAGIDEAHGDLLPDDKIERVRALLSEHQHVGMIGDGVNDAPAMAAATVGIAMGAAGTDTAIETADIALMKDDLSKVAETILLGRRTLHIIQFNIASALAIKAVFLVLAVLGYTSLWLAILADTGATILVILNALRLLRNPREALMP
ncbi:MAG: cation-translocating P-type ATPase [Verrucomicrobiales bacterium]